MANSNKLPNEKLVSLNSLISNYSSKIDKLLNSSTSGINTTYTSAASNNYLSQTISKYLSQSADYLSRSATNSSITRSTNLLTLQTGLKNSIDDLDTDYIVRNFSDNKFVSNSEKSENLHSFSPITPIIDNQSGIFSDCSASNTLKSDKLIYKTIMIIDVLNKMNTSTPMVPKKESVYTHELKKPLVRNVVRKSFNNFYLLNQVDGDFYSYDLLERQALEIDNRSNKTNSLKSKKNKFKKTGKLTINYTNFRKKIKENPFMIYNQNGRKLVKKLISSPKKNDFTLSPSDLDSLFSTINNEYELAFECWNPKRKVVFSKKRRQPRRTIFKITKLCPSGISSRRYSCNSSLSNSYSSENQCSSDNDYQNNMTNKNHIDLSTNDVDPSAEFARADDVYEINGNVKSSDEEFTDSYGDALGTKEVAEIAPIQISGIQTTSETKLPQVLNLIIHRLPGEKLGLNLKVESGGSVVVVSVIENSAADRASDSNGNRCSIQVNDELLEINGVSLNNMSNDDILSVVQELPLHVTLKLKRNEIQVLTSPVIINVNNEAIESGQSTPNNSNTKVPVGYNLHTVYLSSLETKCIMPCDLKECCDIEGLYKMQKSTLQIGEQDNLKKGDILYCINGDQLSFCNKFDLVSKLSNLNGIAEVSVLRKTNNCYGTHTDQIPYHNGIFAQNSIKLAMRKYDKPSIKSNSEIDMANNGLTSSKTEMFSDEIRHSISNINDFQRSDVDVKKEDLEYSSQIFKATLVECKDIEADLNNGLPEPMVNDNWLLYDKNSTEKINKTSIAQSHKFEKTENSITDTCPTFKESESTNPRNHLSEPSLIFDHGTARSFTSSSCHSERSIIHLNCAVCIEDENLNSKVEDIDDESELGSISKNPEQSSNESFPEYSIIVPKSEKTHEISSKFISSCQIEIKTPATTPCKHSNLKIVKPNRVTFEKENDKPEPLENPKSTDLDTLIEDNFAVEIKDMTENDCDFNSGKITSQSSDYCKLSNKNLNDTDNNIYENYEKTNDSVADEQCSSIAYIEPKINELVVIKSVLDSIIQEVETQIDQDSDKTLNNEKNEKQESNQSTSCFGLKETFDQDNYLGAETEATKDDIDFPFHPDETSDTIIDEIDIKDQKVSDSNFECEEPRAEVINTNLGPRDEAEPLNTETTLSRLLKSDSDSSSTNLKHSTQIGLNDTRASSSLSIPPPAPPLPEKLVFCSISDISTIQSSFDQHKSLDRKLLLKKSIKTLKETSLPNMLAEKQNVSSPSSGLGTSIGKKESAISFEEVTKTTGLDSSILSKKTTKWSDRLNSLITPRPFSSLKNSIVKQEKSNNYCKTLMTIKKQNITFSKFFLSQTQALFNDKSIVSNRSNNCSFTNSIKLSPNNEKKIETLKNSPDLNSSNNLNGIITPKCTLPANLKIEKTRKDELVIDYVESAFEKQIKQKTNCPNQLQSQSQTSSNPAISSTTLSGNGPVSNSLNINKFEIEELKREILKQASSRDISMSSVAKEEITPVQELKTKFSVKEKIMLFTQNLPNKESSNKNKIEKTKIYESKISKSILVTSTPSINDTPHSRSSSASKAKISISSFNNSEIKNEEKKLFPTLNKNFTSQPNISSIEKRPELVQSIIINDESIISLNQNDTKICEKESLQSFKSVRDKIAYFSSKVNKADQSQNLNNSASNNRKSNESIASSKISTNNRLANKIETINKIRADSNFDDYDSLKHAYNLGKSCMNLKTCHKEFLTELKTKHSSTTTLNVNNPKLELKNFIHSNENKISDLIENIELKMKKN